MVRKKDLKSGGIIVQNGETMKLIKRQPSWRRDGMKYCYKEIIRPFQEPLHVNYATQRWLVEIDGWRTNRYIHFYHSTRD